MGRHPLLVCVTCCVALALSVSGCGALGSSCANGRHETERGPCSDDHHYLECEGGEGYEYDTETACPDSAPICVASSVGGNAECHTSSEVECASALTGIQGGDLDGGDLNGDGLTDLVYTSGGDVRVALATSTGGFSKSFVGVPAMLAFKLAHSTKTGALGLFGENALGQVFLLPGNGDGTFSTEKALQVGSGGLTLLGVGDADGDGRDDLVVEDSSMTVSLLLSSMKFAPTAITGLAPQSLELALLANATGDSAPELVLGGNPSSSVFTQARGNWMHLQDFEDQLIGAADTDADGVAELFVSSRTDGSSIEHGAPDGKFVASQVSTDSAVVVGDLNADGVTDVVVSNLDAEQVTELIGRGDGSFDAHSPLSLGGLAPGAAFIANTASGAALVIKSSPTLLNPTCLAR